MLITGILLFGMKIEEGVYNIKISSMIWVSQEDKKFKFLSCCQSELEYIFFLKTTGIGRTLPYKQSQWLCIWSIQNLIITKKYFFYGVKLRIKNIVLHFGLQLLIQADVSCKLCTALSESLLSCGYQCSCIS